MTCPVCGEKTRVLGSIADCESVYRRRECKKCSYKFFTTEDESTGLIYNSLKSEANKRSKEKKQGNKKHNKKYNKN